MSDSNQWHCHQHHHQIQDQHLPYVALAQSKPPSQPGPPRQPSVSFVRHDHASCQGAWVHDSALPDAASRTETYSHRSTQDTHLFEPSLSTAHATMPLATPPDRQHDRQQPSYAPQQPVYSPAHHAMLHPATTPSSHNKPLPPLQSTRSTPTSSPDATTKKKRTAMKSLGRFLRSFGKTNGAAQTTPEPTRSSVGDTNGTMVCVTMTDAQCVRHIAPKESSSTVPCALDEPCSTLTEQMLADSVLDPSPTKPRRQVRKHPSADDLHCHHHQPDCHVPRRLGSLQDLRQLPFTDTLTHASPRVTDQKQPHKVEAVVTPRQREDSLSDGSQDDEDGDSEETLQVAQEKGTVTARPNSHSDARLRAEKLIKRLSGGHFGSAGGLIFSTHPLPVPHDIQLDPENEGSWTESPQPTLCPDSPEPESLSDPRLATTERSRVSHCSARDSVNPNPTQESEVEIARRIWEGDDTVYSNLEHIAEWIGNGKPSSTAVLNHYLSFFDFTHCTLDGAFRMLCGKLHLKAETQQIDRILEGFAARYWECNPNCVFGHPDVIHAIVYSLLLLNTDLHVAQSDHKKMSRSAFVQNTMNAVRAQFTRSHMDQETRTTTSRMVRRIPSRKNSATSDIINHMRTPSVDGMSPVVSDGQSIILNNRVWQAEIERLLREMYVSVYHHRLRDPSNNDAAPPSGNRQTRRSSLPINGSRVSALKRGVGTLKWKTARESMLVQEVPEPESDQPLPPTSPRPSTVSVSTATRRQSTASFKSNTSHQSKVTQTKSVATNTSTTTCYQSVAPLLSHSDIPPAYTSGAPYYKEGLIVRKHLLERAGQKARHREWKECFMVVDRGEIRMYKLDSGHGNEHRKRMARASMMMNRIHLGDALSGGRETVDTTVAVGGGDWLANAQRMGEIDLKHTLSQALPSGYSRQRPYAFALQEPNGGVHLFQVGSAEQVSEWVSTCNYWAARESKEPLMGGVSSLEYGWGHCLEQIHDGKEPTSFPVITIHEWIPPEPPMTSSILQETQQLRALHKHIDTLHIALDAHHDIKDAMLRRFSTKTTYGARAMTNWENKSQYLLHEIIKYQNYCDSIEQSLALQDKAVQDEKNKRAA